jgi:hypothetical protein
VTRRDWVWFRFNSCGNLWTEEECFHVYGSQATSLKLKMLCETQNLAGGPYMPPADCSPSITDLVKFPDYCMMANMAASLTLLQTRSLAQIPPEEYR